MVDNKTLHECFLLDDGLIYEAKQEMRKNDDAIARATALLGGEDTHLIRTLVAAVFSAIGIRDRA